MLDHRSLRRPPPAVALILFALCFQANLARSQAVYVVPDTHSTIQAAVDAAGDAPATVLVVGGIYEPFTLADAVDVDVIGQGGAIILGAAGNGINVVDCTDVTVSGFIITQPTGAGISVIDSSQATITNCETVLTGGVGIAVVNSPDVTVERCTFTACGDAGLTITGAATSGTIARNEFLGTENDRDGIIIDDARGVTVDRNTVRATSRHGIFVRTGSHCRLIGNRVDIATINGIRIDGDNNIVEKSRITEAGVRGIDLRGDGNVLSRNRIQTPGSFGIYVDAEADGNSLDGNAVIGGLVDGIRLDASGTRLTGNKIAACARHGIVLAGAGFDILERNGVSKCLGDAIVVVAGTTNSMLIANKVSKNDRGLIIDGDDTLVSRMKGSGNLQYDFVDNADGTTVMSSKFGLALIFE